MNICKNKLGMTVMEVMIAMSVIAIMSVCLVAILLQSIRGWSNGVGTEAASTTATLALQRLYYDIRDGRSATITGSTIKKIVVTFPLTITDAGTGEKAYDAVQNDPLTRTYYVSNGNLVREINGVTSVLAYRVTALKDPTVSGNGIDLTIESEQRVGSTSCGQQVKGHITLRNHT